MDEAVPFGSIWSRLPWCHFFPLTSWTGSMAASLAAISSLQAEGPKLGDSEFYMPELGSFETCPFFLSLESLQKDLIKRVST